MPRATIGVWLTTLLWVAAALGLWAHFDRELKNGTEIALKTEPVDPRDVLRGDYVILRYAVSTAPRENESYWFGDGQTVYVSLVGGEDTGDWQVGALDREAPDEGVFLRARVRSTGTEDYELAYGIERFFVPEGEGRRYEEARNRNRLWAIVSVSPHGVAYLKRLEIRE